VIARDIFAEAIADAARERRRADDLAARLASAEAFVAEKIKATSEIAAREIRASRGLTTQTWHRATAEVAALQMVERAMTVRIGQ
jgi:hypothetical protein